MTHLGERITDYVFGEMSGKDLDEARSHVAACAECRDQVRQFERTRATLRMSQDAEPPRHIVFEVEKKPVFAWRWLAPLGVAAAIVLAVLIAAPMQVQWSDSQLTIAFGKAPAPAVRPDAVTAATPVRQVSEPVDYDRIIKEVQKQLEHASQPSLVSDMNRREADRAKTIQRLQDRLVYLESVQHGVERQNFENANNIALLAQKSEHED